MQVVIELCSSQDKEDNISCNLPSLNSFSSGKGTLRATHYFMAPKITMSKSIGKNILGICFV